MSVRAAGVALAAASLAIAMTTGCGDREQSFREAIELVCEAPTKIPDGRNRLTEAVTAVEPRVTNAKAKELFERMGMSEGGEKLPLMRIAMTEAGLARCTLLEVWEEQRKNPPKLPDDPLNQPIPPR